MSTPNKPKFLVRDRVQDRETGVLGTGTPTNKERLLAAYAAYNRQDGAALLALVSEDVDWPDGSARLHGKAELRAYWTRQWADDAHPR